MILQKNLIGTELASQTVETDGIQVDYLYQSLRVEKYFHHPAEELAERKSMPLPAFFLGSLINYEPIQKILGLNVKNILLSRESITTHRPIFAGEKIKINTYLQDAYEKQATLNPIGFIVLEFAGSTNNEFVFHGERIWAIRGGFERRKK